MPPPCACVRVRVCVLRGQIVAKTSSQNLELCVDPVSVGIEPTTRCQATLVAYPTQPHSFMNVIYLFVCTLQVSFFFFRERNDDIDTVRNWEFVSILCFHRIETNNQLLCPCNARFLSFS